MQIADAISRLAIENSHDPTNMAIPFEDDSAQSRFVENIDPSPSEIVSDSPSELVGLDEYHTGRALEG
jgi:hypothetical protein